MKYLFQLIEESHQIWEATDLIMDSCSSHSEWDETVVPDSETFFCRVVEYNIMRFNGLLNAEGGKSEIVLLKLSMSYSPVQICLPRSAA